MKATRIRAFLGVPALAAVLGLGTYIASADAVSPTGAATASSSNVSIQLGTSTVTCTVSIMHFNAQSSASGLPVCGTISPPPTLSKCTVSASGSKFSATCTASDTWNLCFSSSGAAIMIIPQGGISCTSSILGKNCTITATSVSPSTTISGSWSNGTASATFPNLDLPTTTSGGFPCPSGTSSKFSATYHVTHDADGSGLTIAPN